ncbi:MAG: Bax inhibitor-1/YccA family protein [Kiritimatiellae bacterium]|nr:Bax inhibitor-1/YccA family protein [Kiritimatiellia bacterium]
MVDYESQFEKPEYGLTRQTAVARTFKLVYGWMFAGLAVSGAVAWYAATSRPLMRAVFAVPNFYILIGLELALVFGLSAGIRKIPAALAVVLFMGYSALNGLTLSAIFHVYDLGSIVRVFFISAGMFGGLAVYGTVTKSDLSGVGSFCGMALWGLILAIVVNMFAGSSGLDLVISFAGIVIFTGLTMYDAQKVRQMAAEEGSIDSATVQKLGIIGALALYLDFINIFLYLLKLFGKER